MAAARNCISKLDVASWYFKAQQDVTPLVAKRSFDFTSVRKITSQLIYWLCKSNHWILSSQLKQHKLICKLLSQLL